MQLIHVFHILVADKEGKSAENLKPGGERGFLDHWRCGLIGAVQYWADGSRANAIRMVHLLIKQLGIEVCMCLIQHLPSPS